MPTSTMATSTGASANFQMAMAVSTSKKLIFGLPSSSIFMSTMATRSLTWSQVVDEIVVGQLLAVDGDALVDVFQMGRGV